jgi:hypothetical protein
MASPQAGFWSSAIDKRLLGDLHQQSYQVRSERRQVMSLLKGLVVLSIAAIGCAGTQARSKSVVTLEQDPPADCQSLGEVVGQDKGHYPDIEVAHEEALRNAAKLDATHVRVDRNKTGREGAYTVNWTGIAYRCPVKT